MAGRRAVGDATAPPTDAPSGAAPAGGGWAAGRPAPAEQDAEPDPESVARTICLRLLTVRSRTRAELREALSGRNVPDEAATRVLDRLAAVGLVDDLAFAANFVEAKRAERGLATRELARQLRGKGVDDEIVDAALSDLDAESEHATARRLAERRLRSMSGLEPRVQIRRLAGMLARKGYSPGMSFQVVREVVGATDSDPDVDPESM
ncbi:MAG TPA: regulatory protein RecX [Jatrophihabitans sp.]|nr:regulatory protein RecX [Jatrophihabitans sp.]